MSDVLHNSALRTFKSCEQRWKYEYVDGLADDSGTALNIGTWFHLLMEAQGLKQGIVQDTLLHDVPERLHFGLPDDDNPSVLTSDVLDESGLVSVRAVHDWVVEEVHAYWPEGDDEIDAMPDNLWFLYERYMARHGAAMVREDVLGVEVQWQRDDVFDADAPLDGSIPYGGQADRIVRSNGLIVLRDHKTTGNVPSSSFLLTDSQLHLYAWGLTPWLKEHGLEIDAIEYDFALTYWPKVSLTKKAGNLYSRQRTIDLHAARILLAEALAEHDNRTAPAEGEPFPDDFSDWLDRCATEGDREFFRRHLQPVNVTTVKTLLDEGAVLKPRMDAIENGAPAIRMTGKHCDWCPRQEVCTGDLLGNDTSLLKEQV